MGSFHIATLWGKIQLNSISDIEQERQPFLPRVRMIWFFIIAALVAVALGIIRSAEQGQALAAALVYVAVFIATFFAMAGIFFFVAFLFGSTDRAMSHAHPTTASPFGKDSLPPQIIPPRAADEHV